MRPRVCPPRHADQSVVRVKWAAAIVAAKQGESSRAFDEEDIRVEREREREMGDEKEMDWVRIVATHAAGKQRDRAQAGTNTKTKRTERRQKREEGRRQRKAGS